ncbi:MAG: hypothetical protein HY843_06160 [Bdellovibrio sp.]|nr:hypothetical protein [Bdellovibrio sp.]
MKANFIIMHLVILTFTGGYSFAADSSSFEYPELLVTPRASDRLELEARKEAGSQWRRHFPIQISALSTLLAGYFQLSNNNPTKDPTAKSGLAGVAVGGVWLVTTLALSMAFTPYVSELHEIRTMPSKTQREQLSRERLAEESFERTARLATRLQWLSFLSNFGTSVYLTVNVKTETISVPADIVAIIFSFAPLVFQYSWKYIQQDQEEYKKKIYGPLTGISFWSDPVSHKIAPRFDVSFMF